MLVEVVPLHSTKQLLTYRIDSKICDKVRLGLRAKIPIAKRYEIGLIARLDVQSEISEEKIRTIDTFLDEDPVLPSCLITFLLWIADYYYAPVIDVFRMALPDILVKGEEPRLRLVLSEEGKAALEAQNAILKLQEFAISDAENETLLKVKETKQVLTEKTIRKRFKSSILKRLIDKGWVEEEKKLPIKRRKDLYLEALSADRSLLKRAPRQAALFAQIELVGGALHFQDLPLKQADTRSLIFKLRDKGFLKVKEVEREYDPFADMKVPEDIIHALNHAQNNAVKSVLEEKEFAPFLLKGVTGSGKTEVYLKLIEAVRKNTGKGAIVLVPEISLTPQLAGRFRARFGRSVAVLHSGLSSSARYDQWRRIRSGELSIVVGARSAILAPMENPGIIIVDEEHDPSFKQEEGVKYNARDVALVRGKSAKAYVVLGSATPSLESRHSVIQGRLKELVLPYRATPKPLPEVCVVDLRKNSAAPEGILTIPLYRALKETLERKEQSILFLNRRGFSPTIRCMTCGHVFDCDQCSVSLTHHRYQKQIICHYCGYSKALPERCSECGGSQLSQKGYGTEQVEDVLCARFPEAKVARLDRDTAAGKGLTLLLERFRNRHIDILVGTQMVTKGHDFPHVTCVGVLSADQALHFPDFRAAERTFQLLTQVAGRAGRGDKPGRVFLQTYSPEHPAIQAAIEHDYERFVATELNARQELLYPPFARLATLRFDGTDAALVAKVAKKLSLSLEPIAFKSKVILLGPVEAPLSRLKGKSRWMLLLKSKDRRALRLIVDHALAQDIPHKVRMGIDIDPVQML